MKISGSDILIGISTYKISRTNHALIQRFLGIKCDGSMDGWTDRWTSQKQYSLNFFVVGSMKTIQMMCSDMDPLYLQFRYHELLRFELSMVHIVQIIIEEITQY